MNWKRTLKTKKQTPSKRPYYVTLDMRPSPHLFDWLNAQVEELNTTRSDLVRAILQDAYDEDKESKGS